MIFLQLITVILAGVLNSWGGHSFLPARRFIMPVLLGVVASICCHTWWVGLMILPVMGTLCLGYSDFGTGNFARACWLCLQASIICFGVTVTGHLGWYFAIPYIVFAGVLGGLYKNWQQIWGDLIAGMWLGSFILFVR